MTASLGQFQDAFVRALGGDGGLEGLASRPGFAVYRNTIVLGCVVALAANYPTVETLVGVDWFTAAATVYARRTPPRHPQLLRYGDDFPAFLRGFAPAAALPYLHEVACIDRLWMESHIAADAPLATAAELQALALQAGDDPVAVPHPAARWAWLATPAFSIWRMHRHGGRDGIAAAGEIDWKPEGVLLTRAAGAVRWQPASHALCAFLDASACGAGLLAAAQQAAASDPDADLAALFAQLLGYGALTRFDRPAASATKAAATFLEQ